MRQVGRVVKGGDVLESSCFGTHRFESFTQQLSFYDFFFLPLFKSKTYAEYALRARARSLQLVCWQRTLGGAYAGGKARRLCARRKHSLTGTIALARLHGCTQRWTAVAPGL